MSDELHSKIKSAQTRAGEEVVIMSLANKGLLSDEQKAMHLFITAHERLKAVTDVYLQTKPGASIDDSLRDMLDFMYTKASGHGD